MPFKLKLKKSRHYSVVSKSLFVISVDVLDNTNVECTLSSESTGQDCLDIVCQKLGLNQPKFFGLQYMSKVRETFSWFELDKPIKRQLDKYARDLVVYLRVMYYVISGVRLLNDEVTRYHYFLQLKSDVIEGRISCTPIQAIELASYCMQAEFGNFNPERHTAHYLKDFQLFPKSITDPIFLESLTDAASREHAIFHNIPQGIAEEYYICACQRLERYGQELFFARHKNGADAIIGVSLTGICISYQNGREGRGYSWIDINNVINHKRDFTIEFVAGIDRVEFQFPDVDSAKNAWRFCVLQHTFFRQNEMNVVNMTGNPDGSSTDASSAGNRSHQVETYEDSVSHQRHNLLNTESHEDVVTSTQRAHSTSALDLNTPTDIDKLRSLLPSYRPAPDYETAIQQKYRNSAGAVTNREPIRVQFYSSQPEIHQADTYATHLYPDVTHNNIERKNSAFNTTYQNVIEQRKNSVFGQGYSQSRVENRGNLQEMIENMQLLHLCKPPPPYPSNRMSSNSTPDLAGISHHAKPLADYFHNVVSGSSPDLVSGGGNFLLKQHHQYGGPHALYANQGGVHPVHRSHSYLPTASAQHQQHGTYENLSSIFGGGSQALIVENSSSTRKMYDERNKILYLVRDNQIPSGAAAGYVVTRNHDAIAEVNDASGEPIYENVPLPWRNQEGGSMRARAQSIDSTPVMLTQVVNQSVVNALQAKLQQQLKKTGSKENLYANIERNSASAESSRTELNLLGKQSHASRSFQNLNQSSGILSRSSQNLAANESPGKVYPGATNAFTTSTPNASPTSGNSTFAEANNYNGELVSGRAENSSSSASSGSAAKKKKRWGILMGRSKSGEKVKSATLGREKDKGKDKNQTMTRHRWSTGLPRFNPLPPSISKETMCQLLENKLADSQLFFEFDKIPKKKQNADFTTAMLPENAIFNTYKDILPYEDNRLRLTPTKDNKYGYINASPITATVGSKQRFYVAAQGPTKATLPYFWQCVWEAEVYLLVQLNDHGDEQKYLPDDAGERCIDVGHDYQVWWEFSQKAGHCVTSKVRLCHVSSRRYRILWHLHYSEWGDQGCPQSVAHFLGFLEELKSVQQYSMCEIPPGHNKNPPVLVHCTAGVGRTGLTILCDLLLYTVDHNQEVDISRVVNLLRHQRVSMVQTVGQYRFVYSLLIHYLKQTRLI